MQVRIYQAAKNAMQSGRANRSWRIEPVLETARLPEPLMGWASSGDTLNQIRLRFASREEAERFAHKQGWAFTADAPAERRVTPRNYTDNFKARRRGA